MYSLFFEDLYKSSQISVSRQSQGVNWFWSLFGTQSFSWVSRRKEKLHLTFKVIFNGKWRRRMGRKLSSHWTWNRAPPELMSKHLSHYFWGSLNNYFSLALLPFIANCWWAPEFQAWLNPIVCRCISCFNKILLIKTIWKKKSSVTRVEPRTFRFVGKCWDSWTLQL